MPARVGPRPLPLYLALAQLLWLSLPAASLSLKNDFPNSSGVRKNQSVKKWPENLRVKQNRLRRQWQKLSQRDKNADRLFDDALNRLAVRQYDIFLNALKRYRACTVARHFSDPSVIWQQGTTRLLDFSLAAHRRSPVALVIPSLINRYHVLDLDKQQSFIRALAKAGFAPLMVDWGSPGPEEIQFGFDEYMSKRLLPALHVAQKLAGDKVHIIGYCMGGLLAAALAMHAAEAIRSLVFMATPWNFHGDALGREQAKRVQNMLPQITPILEQQGILPVDVLQCFFISLQPFVLLEKFLRFAAMKRGSKAERAFVLIEDWVNDGVPLPAKVAKTCLNEWYIDNTPFNGRWRVLGKSIRPQDISLPSLHVIPQNDKIVPPASAMDLAKGMNKATILQPECGHISMMCNAAARDKLWPALFSWLASH